MRYRSVPGKRPWALKHNSRFWPAWALTQDQNSIRLYRSCYSDPLKCGTWALARDTMVIMEHRDRRINSSKVGGYLLVF